MEINHLLFFYHWHTPGHLVDLPQGSCLAIGHSLPHLQHRDVAIPSEVSHHALLSELEAPLGQFLGLLNQSPRKCVPAGYCLQPLGYLMPSILMLLMLLTSALKKVLFC